MSTLQLNVSVPVGTNRWQLVTAVRMVLALVLLVAHAQDAAADFIVNTFDGSSVIYTINADTGATTLLGSAGVQLTDVALSPGGQLYGATLTSLYSLNTLNGAGTLVGSFTTATSMIGLDFGTGGQLYGVAGDGKLYAINPTTGAATSVFFTGFGYAGDVAHAGGNIFYATSNTGGESHLIEINAGTLAAVDRGLIASGQLCPGLDFDLSGRLIAFANTGKSYYIPNYSSSGAGTYLSDSGVIMAGATTLPAPLPEPGSLLLASLGLVGLWYRARFRRPV